MAVGLRQGKRFAYSSLFLTLSLTRQEQGETLQFGIPANHPIHSVSTITHSQT
jgi:hypothetical protein